MSSIATNNNRKANFESLMTRTTNQDSVANFKPDAIQNAGSKAEKSGLGLNADFTTFIKMLTEQLKNQDPTDPLDVNQFTEQIVSFTAVEQAVATNANLEKLIELNKGVQFSHASGLVGQEVVYDSSTAEIKEGETAQFAYSLEPIPGQKISSTKIRVVDSSGTIVKMTDGGLSEGLNVYAWDGLDFNGKKAKSNTYHIDVFSVDPEGKPIRVGTSMRSGVVSEAEITAGTVMLTIDGKKIPVSQIKSLKSAKTEAEIGENSLNKLSEIFTNKVSQSSANADTDKTSKNAKQ